MRNANELDSVDSEQLESNVIPPADVFVFNEQRSCAELMRLHTEGQLNISPDFQRNFVWSQNARTRFIDSLSKQLPIPSICIALDNTSRNRIVIDGLQRISSIIEFLSDDEKIKPWKLSRLSDVDTRLSDKTNKYIKENHKDIYSDIQNVTIPVTIIRYDKNKNNHCEYLYTIFHRLNTGGAKLNNQEIRNGVLNGSFNNLLTDLAKNIGPLLIGKNIRYRNEEFILRFFAFHYTLDKYSSKLNQFLYDFMFNNREIDVTTIAKFRTLFLNSLKIYNLIVENEREKITQLSRTAKEGVFFGISKNIATLQNKSNPIIISMFNHFVTIPEFSKDNLKDGLADKGKLIARLNAAANCFA